MDPRLFDIITVQNIDSEPFEVIYDSKSFGILQPGDTRRLPRYLARHAVKHLIDQCLNRVDKPTNNQAARDELATKIVIDEEAYLSEKPVSEAEKLQQEIERLNTTSDIDNLLDKRKAALAQEEAQTPQPAAPVQESAPEASPVPEAPSAPVADSVQSVEVAPEVVETPPITVDEERTKVLNYARDTMGVNLEDAKTKAHFDTLTTEQLKTEVQYESQ